MKDFTILLASDHAGFELKKEIATFLIAEGYKVEDLGATELKKDDDYPEYIAPLGVQIAQHPEAYRGIIFGKSGQGEAIVANRFPEVRAAVYYGGNPEIIKLSREHNDANVLSLGAGFISPTEAKEAVKLWLETPFSEDERHARRIEMIEQIM